MGEPTDTAAPDRVATGIPGLDDVLGGGVTPNRVYLVEGNPGSGKTTLALQCLLEGARLGESGIYVTLSETNGASLEVSRPILRQFGDGPRVHQARRSFRPTFPRPRLPASWAVADPVVGDRLQ